MKIHGWLAILLTLGALESHAAQAPPAGAVDAGHDEPDAAEPPDAQRPLAQTDYESVQEMYGERERLLIRAAQHGDLPAVRALLAEGRVNVNATTNLNGHTP
jgi:hypothetical protein